ncbi:MAG TPA: hypothetical protein VKK31_18720 [Thermoanaerobaculia bacterium]|nr:hypothetical protein [Thermoanaerobaculia bacterium]
MPLPRRSPAGGGRIRRATDGGATFNNLLASTPNDGTQSVTLPSTLGSLEN